MKKKCFMGVFVIGLVVPTVFLILPFSINKGALLAFSKTHYEYGEVGYNQTVTLKMDFVNGGDKPLRIHKITPSCKCTVNRLEKRTYEPKEKGQIEVQFLAKEEPGHLISYTLAFQTNDYKKPLRVIELTARMKPSVTVFPREIFLGSVRAGETRKAEVIISPSDTSEEFELTSATTTISGSEICFSRLRDFSEVATSFDYTAFPPETSYLVLLQLQKQNTLGTIFGSIEIKTTSRVSPVISVPVHGEIVSSFVINPHMLFFSLTQEKKIPTRVLTISNEFPFEIEIPSDHPHLHLATETEFPNKECTLLCTVKGGCLTQNAKGMLHFQVKGHHCEEKLYIPYTIIILK